MEYNSPVTVQVHGTIQINSVALLVGKPLRHSFLQTTRNTILVHHSHLRPRMRTHYTSIIS